MYTVLGSLIRIYKVLSATHVSQLNDTTRQS